MKAISLDGLAKYLKDKKKILVSGPCRSGTTICSHILLDYLDREFIESFREYDDSENTKYYATSFYNFLLINDNMDDYICHGPHFSPFLTFVPKDVTIVFMRRNPEDVSKSAYSLEDGKWSDGYYSYHTECVIDVKDAPKFRKMRYGEKVYFAWDNYQKPKMNNYIEVDYNILRGHRFFLPKEKRKNFRERQWRE